MKMNDIFDAFSRRNKEPQPYTSSVPITSRNRIFYLCNELFGQSTDHFDYTDAFWNEIRYSFIILLGKGQRLIDNKQLNAIQDVTEFLSTCSDEHYLTFIEYIFKVKRFPQLCSDENALVATINEIFALDNIAYELTEMIKEDVQLITNDNPSPDLSPHLYPSRPPIIEPKVISYPQIIRKDDQIVHATTVKPTLQLLKDPKFKTANKEFLEALEHYRKGENSDCLTKCGSAFESVMKIICDKKRWRYNQNDTASPLIMKLINNKMLEPYFEQPLIAIATLRNHLSSAHGAGVKEKDVPPEYASYLISITAAAIILLVHKSK
ncbi:MAG: hypothetical protein ABSA51_10325 [Anaerolineaceae bacterium]|jgi:hypothetical protein